MLKVEYLIFIDNESIKCCDIKTFNHLLQSDPNISIENKKIIYNKLAIDYNIKNGKVKNTDNSYFHLIFECTDINNIDDFNDLLRAVRSVLHITNKSPQTLYDWVSLYYTQLAYPLVFDIESLMRKLITKFMLTNIGIDWITDRVPEDVRNSINKSNSDLTYLHNVDFIQLKHFLFSENYPSHKEALIKKLKNAKEINDIALEDIKSLIPNSNWEKYFSEKVNTTKEQLSKQWDELYELRCHIAHNRAFSKKDYERVRELSTDLKIVIQSAIENLNEIDVPDTEKDQLTESIFWNFNVASSEFMSYWRDLNWIVRTIIKSKVENKYPENKELGKSFSRDLEFLVIENIISTDTYLKIKQLKKVRDMIVHNMESRIQEEILLYNNEIKFVIEELCRST